MSTQFEILGALKVKYALILFTDQRELWKLDGGKLVNKTNLWQSDDDWIFRHNADGTIYIENVSKNTVLGTTEDDDVIEEILEENNLGQLWKQGKPTKEGFFTLENSYSEKVMTAISDISVIVKGKHNKRLSCFWEHWSTGFPYSK